MVLADTGGAEDRDGGAVDAVDLREAAAELVRDERDRVVRIRDLRVEELPLVHALMRQRRRSTRYARDRWARDFLAENRAFRRYILRELERNGPLPSRRLEDRAASPTRDHRWYGSRRVGQMLMVLHQRGEIAVAGRSGGERLWDLAERWYPETETVPVRTAESRLAERRFRRQGVRRTPAGWEAHPQATDGAVPDRVTLLSPFDPLTLSAAALGLLLVTMAVCYVPARRALGIEPARELLHE